MPNKLRMCKTCGERVPIQRLEITDDPSKSRDSTMVTIARGDECPACQGKKLHQN